MDKALPKDTFHNLPKEKRDAILDVAADEFARFSYARASLSRIVSRLGIAKGSIYQYFENKLDLYRFILEEGSRAKLRFFGDKIVPEPGHFFDWMEEAFVSGLRFAAEHPRLAHISMALFFGHEPELRGFAERLRKVGLGHMESLIREAQLHREIRDDVDAATLAIVIGSMQQHGLWEVLRVKVGADRVEDLFDNHRLDALSDDELRAIVHQFICILQSGAATTEGPRPVEGVRSRPFDVEGTMDRAFAPQSDDAKSDDAKSDDAKSDDAKSDDANRNDDAGSNDAAPKKETP